VLGLAGAFLSAMQSPPAVMGHTTWSPGLDKDLHQLSQQLEATMQQAAMGNTPSPAHLQAMQAQVAQMMAQFETTAPPPGPIASLACTAPSSTSIQSNIPSATSTPVLVGTESIDEIARWVEEQRSELSKAENSTKFAAAENGGFVGVVGKLSPTLGTGWIEGKESFEKYGRHVQISQDQLEGLQVGDTVVFRVSVSAKGVPQACFVRKLLELTLQRQRILEVEAPLPAPGAVESAQVYLGLITSFQADTGFGFIGCTQTRDFYGCDVYIHRDQFLDLASGDSVHFRVALNPKGVPVARSVRKAGFSTTTEPSQGPDAAYVHHVGDARADMQKLTSGSTSRSKSLSEGAQLPIGTGAALQACAPDPKKKNRSRSQSSSMSMSCSKSPTKGGAAQAGLSSSQHRAPQKVPAESQKQRSSSESRPKRRARSKSRSSSSRHSSRSRKRKHRGSARRRSKSRSRSRSKSKCRSRSRSRRRRSSRSRRRSRS